MSPALSSVDIVVVSLVNQTAPSTALGVMVLVIHYIINDYSGGSGLVQRLVWKYVLIQASNKPRSWQQQTAGSGLGTRLVDMHVILNRLNEYRYTLMVLPMLVGGSWPQPPLSLFYHHLSNFDHHSKSN